MSQRSSSGTAWWVGLCIALLVIATAGIAGAQTAKFDKRFNTSGNILISDQYNNRVIEVDRATHEVVWQFGDESSTAGPHSVVAPNDAQRIGPLTLISGTGAPAGAEPTCPDGCPDNRVIIVGPLGKILWQYGETGVSGSDFNQLNAPVAAIFTPYSTVIITDQGNQRVIEVSLSKKILWQYGTTGVGGSDANQLNDPNSAELLRNGHVLIADEGNNRVIEVTRRNKIVWSYGDPNDTTILNGPAFASRLSDGDTLISDASNNRIVSVTPEGVVDFEYYTNGRPGSVADPIPTRAVRLENGNTLISDQYNHQVIEIDPNEDVVFEQGEIGVSGDGFDMLNGPYDAKVIGDYTGLTPPFNQGSVFHHAL